MPAPSPYPLAERLTEAALYFVVILSPWAFGTTQEWAIWLMNAAGYLLGALWLCKRWVRWRTGYRPPRWGEEVPARGESARYRPHTRAARWLTRSLAALTFLTLGYCLVSALNGRATYLLPERFHDYHDRYVLWLPHSYADNLTWSTFWTYLGLACLFWAARDWLLGKTDREGGESKDEFGGGPPAPSPPLPGRLTRLLWVLCLNGTVLGMVSIFQRLDGTDKLLWLVKPQYGGPDFHFGPFSYRGNGAQYFNLLWPVSLAFWWTLFRASQGSRRAGARIGGDPHLVLLPCVLVQLACPVISASHGGAVITTVLTVGALGVLLAANWHAALPARLAMLVPFVLGLALVLYLGWSQFQQGFLNAFTDDLGDRLEIHQNARRMAVDHPVFGTGPGSFSALYHLYRADTKHAWAVYAHNDWLETIITFGWIGFGLVFLMLAHVFARWWIRDGIGCRGDVTGLIWLALAGCLFHARFDFPLQIYSVLLLFLLLCCVCCCVGREEAV
jgi:O-antigen ligase